MTHKEAAELSKNLRMSGGEPERLLRDKCRWEQMGRIAVLKAWGDPKTWQKK